MERTEQQIRDQEHQEDLAKLRGLRPIDDDFMRCIFRNNKPLAQLVLRILTGKKDLIVQELETQADFKRLDSEGKPLFNDEEHILYVNGAYRGDNDIGRLMHDFRCWNPDDMNYDLMKSAARYYKEDPKGVAFMCEAFEETRKAGEKKGELKRAIEDAKRMIAKGKLTLEDIAEYVELPLEQVQELAGVKA